MRSLVHPALATLGLVAACHAPRPAAVAPERAPDRVWLVGTSNVRRFTCRSDSARVALALPAGATVDGVLAGARPVVTAALALPVATLDCGIRTQSRHLHETLRADAAPAIEFRLATWRLAPAVGGDVPATLDGTLRIAGRERTVTLAAVVRRDAAGAARLVGEHRLRPSDFGVTPPRRFAGLLRVRDDVVVHWDVALRPDRAAASDAAR